ncbi:MAG: HEAT repeat domain-containing protein [Anaerosomatales bacterium]|nr:HEAT repeat domain-containing protein [Anaerosomatales bacterium]
MAPDAATMRTIETVVRALTTAGKTLRLYPPSSPIPRQSVEAAESALAEYLSGEPVLPLTVARDGFTFAGEPIAAAGGSEFAGMLQAHGVAEVDFLPGCGADDLVGFLTLVLEEPATVRERGGLGTALESAGIETLRVSDVSLTVVDVDALGPEDGDIDEFLRELASDPDKLAVWLQSVTKGDPASVAEGLSELVAAAGGDPGALAEALSSAFLEQETEGRDVLLGLAAKESDLSGLFGQVFGAMGTTDVATSLVSGSWGKNMLSMSTMLTKLPIGQRLDAIMAEVKPLLAQAGHTAREMEFLQHMMEVRASEEPEAPLAEARPDYQKVAAIADVGTEELTAARTEALRSISGVNARSVATMLSLLDQQEDFDLYCKTLDGLVSVVPSLLEQRELDLALRVLSELVSRESRTDLPWPELADKLRDAIARATDRRGMAALLHAVAEEPKHAAKAVDLLKRAGGEAQAALVEEALEMRDTDGLALAESLLGRRIIDILVALAPRVQWFQVAPVVKRLATESDPRSTQALEAVLKRPDDQSRREAARGLESVASPAAARHLATLMRDASPEVAVAAVRAAGRSASPGMVAALDALLGELDIDTKDFQLAREAIGALSRSPDSAADAVLGRLASRKALIKRGHFSEVQALTQQAIAARGGA